MLQCIFKNLSHGSLSLFVCALDVTYDVFGKHLRVVLHFSTHSTGQGSSDEPCESHRATWTPSSHLRRENCPLAPCCPNLYLLSWKELSTQVDHRHHSPSPGSGVWQSDYVVMVRVKLEILIFFSGWSRCQYQRRAVRCFSWSAFYRFLSSHEKKKKKKRDTKHKLHNIISVVCS